MVLLFADVFHTLFEVFVWECGVLLPIRRVVWNGFISFVCRMVVGIVMGTWGNVPQNNHERLAGICKKVLVQFSGMEPWSYVLSPSALFSPGGNAPQEGISVSYSDKIHSGQAS